MKMSFHCACQFSSRPEFQRPRSEGGGGGGGGGGGLIDPYLKIKKSSEKIVNALNNVFALKNLSCMSLHAISVFDKVYK